MESRISLQKLDILEEKVIIFLSSPKEEESLFQRLTPYQSLRIQLDDTKAMHLGPPQNRNFWTVSVKPCAPAILLRRICSRAAATFGRFRSFSATRM